MALSCKVHLQSVKCEIHFGAGKTEMGCVNPPPHPKKVLNSGSVTSSFLFCEYCCIARAAVRTCEMNTNSSICLQELPKTSLGIVLDSLCPSGSSYQDMSMSHNGSLCSSALRVGLISVAGVSVIPDSL